ncbi:hypothetical protein U9J35_22195 [Rossellomorea aquimaris]|nr:hypothetical protein [Rossellomorea aquimaris]WRP06529.1 hypothetical protein U9J35_22195 [Rossellomorea aquimaris]
MKLIVTGAASGTGKEVVSHVQRKDHEITPFARIQPNKYKGTDFPYDTLFVRRTVPFH